MYYSNKHKKIITKNICKIFKIHFINILKREYLSSIINIKKSIFYNTPFIKYQSKVDEFLFKNFYYLLC